MSLSWVRAASAGIIAGVLATVSQLVLWCAFTDDLPRILYRDARLTAAILMGPGVLPPPSTFDLKIMMVATVIHVGLSVAYGLILVLAIHRLGMTLALFSGLVFGLILYVVNMYGITEIFPWFSAARDWITIVAHVVFGISVAAAYKVSANKSVRIT
jgi:uncharacterized membrane protein YagU involved in acid resistance